VQTTSNATQTCTQERQPCITPCLITALCQRAGAVGDEVRCPPKCRGAQRIQISERTTYCINGGSTSSEEVQAPWSGRHHHRRLSCDIERATYTPAAHSHPYPKPPSTCDTLSRTLIQATPRCRALPGPGVDALLSRTGNLLLCQAACSVSTSSTRPPTRESVHKANREPPVCMVDQIQGASDCFHQGATEWASYWANCLSQAASGPATVPPTSC
jgi:hypothetical protein